MIFFLLRSLTYLEQVEPAMFTEFPSSGVAAFMGFACESGSRALKRPPVVLDHFVVGEVPPGLIVN